MAAAGSLRLAAAKPPPDSGPAPMLATCPAGSDTRSRIFGISSIVPSSCELSAPNDAKESSSLASEL